MNFFLSSSLKCVILLEHVMQHVLQGVGVESFPANRMYIAHLHMATLLTPST
jgi:hypothetical protein